MKAKPRRGRHCGVASALLSAPLYDNVAASRRLRVDRRRESARDRPKKGAAGLVVSNLGSGTAVGVVWTPRRPRAVPVAKSCVQGCTLTQMCSTIVTVHTECTSVAVAVTVTAL